MAIAENIDEMTPQGLYELAREVSFKIRRQEKISPSCLKEIGFEELYHCYALTIGSPVLETPFLNRRGVQIPLRQFIGGVFLDFLLRQENENSSDILKLFSDLNKTINKPRKKKGQEDEIKIRKRFLKSDLTQAVWEKIIYEGYNEDDIKPFLYNQVGFSSNIELNLFSFADFCSASDFPAEIYKRLSRVSRRQIRNNTKDAKSFLKGREQFLDNFLKIKDFGLNNEKEILVACFMKEGIRETVSGNFNQGISLIRRIKKGLKETDYLKILQIFIDKEIDSQQKSPLKVYGDFLEKADRFLRIDIIEHKRESVSVINNFSCGLALRAGIPAVIFNSKVPLSVEETSLIRELNKVR